MRKVLHIYGCVLPYKMAEKVRNWAPLYSGHENIVVKLCVIGRATQVMTYFFLWEGHLFGISN